MNGKRTSPSSLAPLLLLAAAANMAAQPVTIPGVKHWANKSAKSHSLVDVEGALTFDDAARKVVLKAGKSSFEASYESVRRVVFDQSTHMRAGKALEKLLGGVIGDTLASQKISNYWMYVERATPGGPVAADMLEIPAKFAAQTRDKATEVFGDRAQMAQVVTGAPVKMDTLKDVKSKHTLELDGKNHPTPELKPDKALVIAVCPLVPGHRAGEIWANQVKLHANDRVVVVNQLGSYGFAYLDPGDYQMASQSHFSASVLQTTLEAGKAYYFFQDSFSDDGSLTQLSLHGPEVGLLQMSGAVYAKWSRNPGK